MQRVFNVIIFCHIMRLFVEDIVFYHYNDHFMKCQLYNVMLNSECVFL